jgi:biopolymer transport protein ExbD
MRAKYETVVDVVNEIRAAGVDQLGLITEKVESRQLAQNL